MVATLFKDRFFGLTGYKIFDSFIALISDILSTYPPIYSYSCTCTHHVHEKTNCNYEIDSQNIFGTTET